MIPPTNEASSNNWIGNKHNHSDAANNNRTDGSQNPDNQTTEEKIKSQLTTEEQIKGSPTPLEISLNQQNTAYAGSNIPSVQASSSTTDPLAGNLSKSAPELFNAMGVSNAPQPRSIDGHAIVNRVRAQAKSIDPNWPPGLGPNHEKLRQKQFLNDYASQLNQFLEKNGNNGMINERDLCTFSASFQSPHDGGLSNNIDVKKTADDLRQSAASLDGMEKQTIPGGGFGGTPSTTMVFSESEIIAKEYANEMADKLEAFGQFIGKGTLSEADNLTFNLLNSSSMTGSNESGSNESGSNEPGSSKPGSSMLGQNLFSMEKYMDKAISVISDATGWNEETIRTTWNAASVVANVASFLIEASSPNPFTVKLLWNMFGVVTGASRLNENQSNDDLSNDSHLDGDLTNGEYTDDRHDPNGPGGGDDDYYA
jgi:hypothetical protein